MKCSNLKKKAACMLSVLSLCVNSSNSSAEDTKNSVLIPVQSSNNNVSDANNTKNTVEKIIGNTSSENSNNNASNANNIKNKVEETVENTSSENSEIDKLKQEIKNNAHKKKIYKKNISGLKIDNYTPESAQAPKKELKKTPMSQMINFIVGLGFIGGLAWAAKSLVSIIWQRLARGVHLKNSKEHKEMLRYVSELSSFGLAAVSKIAVRISKDKKAALCIINSNDYENQDIKISDLGEQVENLIIFCQGSKSVNITELSNKIKKLSVVSGGCIKICKVPKVEFFYAKCSGLIVDEKNEIAEESQLKEAILNIQSFVIATEEENKISSIKTSEELFDLIKNKNKVFLGGNKPSNAQYKAIKGLISNHGFGKDNWFTIYREDSPNK